MRVMMDLTMMSQREAPVRLRSATMRQVCEALGASAGLFFSMDQREGGLHFGQTLAMGGLLFVSACEALAGRPIIQGAVGPLDDFATGRCANQFASLSQEWALQDPRQGQGWDQFMKDHLLCDQRRLVVCNSQGVMVGTLIAFKKEGQGHFDDGRAGELVSDACDAIVLAEMFERPHACPQEIYVMYSTHGELMLSSCEAPEWLDARRSEACARLVEDLTQSQSRRACAAFDGVHVELEQMYGSQPCVLVVLTPQTPPTRVSQRLSRRELCIAEFLAVGATTEEIARHFHEPAEQVDVEVERIYTRLGARDRRDLAETLRQKDV